MTWKGKVIMGALGYFIARLPGLVVGLIIGHFIDKKVEQIQSWNPLRAVRPEEKSELNKAQFDAIFAILGCLAKADGQVSPQEIRQVEGLMSRMNLSEDKRREAITLFNWGKTADFPLDEVVATFRARTQRHKMLIFSFLEILVGAALADGGLHDAETQVLLRVAQGLGIPEAQFRQILSMLTAQANFHQGGGFHQGGAGQQRAPRQGPSLAQAYGVLGIDSNVTDAEVKKAYRRLMSRHHPDKLAAQGMSEEMIRVATEKTAKISQAYDIIKESRGFK